MHQLFNFAILGNSLRAKDIIEGALHVLSFKRKKCIFPLRIIVQVSRDSSRTLELFSFKTIGQLRNLVLRKFRENQHRIDCELELMQIIDHRLKRELFGLL